MIRITAALECDGCGTTYDEARFNRVPRLERWIRTVREDARHPTNPERERWSDALDLGVGVLRRGDYCPRCQQIAARQSLEVKP